MRNHRILLVLLSALLASLYALTVFNMPAGYLFEFKKMLSLNGPEAKLKFNLQPARYLLKVKHANKPGLAKKIFINDNEIRPFRIRKKEIETDWLYVEPRQIKGEDILNIEFRGSLPPNVDIRMNNFIAPPQDYLGDDIFILFKSPASLPRFNLLIWLTVFLLFLSFSRVNHSVFLKRRVSNGIFYILRSSVPFIFLMIIVNAVNLLPFNPYRIYFSRFFFCVVFVMSYFLISLLLVPEAERRITV